MLFTRGNFLFLFLPVVVLVHLVLPKGWRNFFLAIASLFFYTVGERAFLPWMIASIAINHFVGRGLERHRGTVLAKWYLGFGVAVDLLLLLVFKYAGFLGENLNSFTEACFGTSLLPPLVVALPLGISFFSFHKLSYKIDVYRGVASFKQNPFDLAFYILFFPQLIAGPIVRYCEVDHQIEDRRVTLSGFTYGVARFVIGLGKKTILANPLGFVADQVFEIPAETLYISAAWLGIVCYSLQIYFDFSGYSDMAIGLARMFGIRFPENFNYPYVSRSITEFWRRWHMSLSRCFRDYVYIPLGGSRTSEFRTYVNLVTVFILCGLWHGASWNFLVWGLYHGFFLVLERLRLQEFLRNRHAVFQHSYSLLVIMGGWVLFRTDDLKHAGNYFSALFGLMPITWNGVSYDNFWNSEIAILLILAGLFSTPLKGWITQTWKNSRQWLPKWTHVAHTCVGYVSDVAVLTVIFLYSLIHVASGSYNPFIYFRF